MIIECEFEFAKKNIFSNIEHTTIKTVASDLRNSVIAQRIEKKVRPIYEGREKHKY